MAELKIQFLGATKTVTGSKTLISAGRDLSDRLLIDCGMFQGSKENRLRNRMAFPVDPISIGTVLITHAHLDHCGYLPRLVRDGFKGPIYCTQATADLMRILLLDAAHLQEEDAEYANQKGFSKHHPALPLYTKADVEETLDLIRTCSLHEPVPIGNHIEAGFHEAGHILGSNMISLRVKNRSKPCSVLFSGDLGRYGTPLLKEPENPGVPDYLILESTYGNRLHDNIDSGADLSGIINDCMQQNGVLVIPAFAIGRTQHLLYLLRQLQAEEIIPFVPIYVDSPMAIEVIRIYAKHYDNLDLEARYMREKGVVSFSPVNLQIASTRDESKMINNVQSKAIIISASGMATGGRILHHLFHRIQHPQNTVLFIGYQAEGTRGRSLTEGASEIKIHGEIIPVKAQIKRLDGLSAHADKGEILNWLSRFDQKPKTIFLNHGESPDIDSFGDTLKSKYHCKVKIPNYLDEYALID